MIMINLKLIDITELSVDAIVNAANEELQPGGGVCGAIFAKAGYEKLVKACEEIGHCKTGDARITSGFKLKARYIIHAVGPVYIDGHHNERELLFNAYDNSMILARKCGLKSIAFPLISAGIYGYPKKEAFMVAYEALNKYEDMNITLAVIDQYTYNLGYKLYEDFKRDHHN